MAWECRHCTFENANADFLACEMCVEPRAAAQVATLRAPEEAGPAKHEVVAAAVDDADGDAAGDAGAPPAKKPCARSVPVISLGGVLVPCVGLGTLALGVCYPAERPPRCAALDVVRRAYANGVRLFDAADVYCRDQDDLHYAEKLLGEALRGKPGVVARRSAARKYFGEAPAHASLRAGGLQSPRCARDA